jgi:hypothetical protein
MRNNNHYWDPTDNHNRKNETREKKKSINQETIFPSK